MTEAHVPLTEEQRATLTVVEGGASHASDPSEVTPDQMVKVMGEQGMDYIARGLRLKPEELSWLRSEDAAAVLALFDLILTHFAASPGLDEKEILRLGLFLAESATDDEISAATKEKYAKNMALEDVALEREDIMELLERGLKKRGCARRIREVLDSLKQEAQPVKETMLSPEPTIAASQSPARVRAVARKAINSERISSRKPAATPENDGVADLDDDTGLSQDALGMYMQRAGKVTLLTAEEEVELAKSIEAGLYAKKVIEDIQNGREVKTDATLTELEEIVRQAEADNQRFISANLRLVISIAKKYAGKAKSMTVNDLVQEGNAGLIHAVEKFDYTKGFKFSTYGTWWIRQSLSRAIGDYDREIRYPIHLNETLTRIEKARRLFEAENFRAPTEQELSAATDISVQKLSEIENKTRDTRNPVRLNQLMEEGGDTEYGDLLASTSDEISQNKVLADMTFKGKLPEVFDVANLTQRERDILLMRHGFEGDSMILDDIAKVYDLTRERIRQIISTAEEKIRTNTEAKAIVQALGIIG